MIAVVLVVIVVAGVVVASVVVVNGVAVIAVYVSTRSSACSHCYSPFCPASCRNGNIS